MQCALDAPQGRPRARRGQIRRTRLLEQVASRTEPVVVLSAPAGYGKSIFAAQMCQSDPRACAWCAMLESDNDPLALINHIVGALGEIRAVPDRYLEACRHPSTRGEAGLLPGLVDLMVDCAPFMLVLDDLHLVTSARSEALLRDVVRALPAGCRLTIGTRADPEIGLARLRVAQQVAEVRAPALALDRDEISLFLDAAGVAHDSAAVAELERITEGWPAGVALTTLSLDTPALAADTVRQFSGSGHDVAEFLFEEVLARQEPSLRTFLIETSVVQRLSARLCDFMLERSGSGDILRQLERTNLFIVALDEQHEWFRYHHLFRDMLRVELDRTEPDRARALLRRAGVWHERDGAPEEAFEYARVAGDFRLAGRVALRHWEEYVHFGRLESLRLWLMKCRDDQIESDTALSIGAGWVFAQLGDGGRAERYLAAAERGDDLDEPSPDGATSLRSQMVNLRSVIGTRGVAQMLEDGRYVYASESTRRTRWMLGACRAIGIAHVLLGQPDEAIAVFEEALVLTQKRDELRFVRLICLGYLALAHIDKGEWTAAREHVREADALINTLGLHAASLALPGYTANAVIHAHKRRHDLALEWVAAVADNIEVAAAGPWMVADVASRCAEVALLSGDEAGAGRLTERAGEALRRMPDAGIVSARVAVLVDRLEHPSPELSSLTSAEIRVLRQLATHLTLAEIAQELFVSRATVKNQVASIYRKVGVASRSEAVDLLGGTWPVGAPRPPTDPSATS